MNSVSAKDQQDRLVKSIVHKRMQKYRGRTNVQASIRELDWDRMSSPKIFCNSESVDDPSFELVMFYDLLSQSSRVEQTAFIKKVINNVVDDPHCECAASLDQLNTRLTISDSIVDELVLTGAFPKRKAEKRVVAGVAEATWPTTGPFALV